jgi:hypothetical protein
MSNKVERYRHRYENYICIIDKKLDDGRVWVLLVGGGTRCAWMQDLIPCDDDNAEQNKQLKGKRTNLRFFG